LWRWLARIRGRGLGSAIGHELIEAAYRMLFTRIGEVVQKLQMASRSLQ
jgi:hypothetical protein